MIMFAFPCPLKLNPQQLLLNLLHVLTMLMQVSAPSTLLQLPRSPRSQVMITQLLASIVNILGGLPLPLKVLCNKLHLPSLLLQQQRLVQPNIAKKKAHNCHICNEKEAAAHQLSCILPSATPQELLPLSPSPIPNLATPGQQAVTFCSQASFVDGNYNYSQGLLQSPSTPACWEPFSSLEEPCTPLSCQIPMSPGVSQH